MTSQSRCIWLKQLTYRFPVSPHDTPLLKIISCITFNCFSVPAYYTMDSSGLACMVWRHGIFPTTFRSSLIPTDNQATVTMDMILGITVMCLEQFVSCCLTDLLMHCHLYPLNIYSVYSAHSSIPKMRKTEMEYFLYFL